MNLRRKKLTDHHPSHVSLAAALHLEQRKHQDHQFQAVCSYLQDLKLPQQVGPRQAEVQQHHSLQADQAGIANCQETNGTKLL